MAVVGNDPSRTSVLNTAHLAIPLGITIATFGAILLVAYVGGRFSQRTRGEQARVGGVTAEAPAKEAVRPTEKRSVATELAPLSELYSGGVLSLAEFESAKKLVLGG